jgi:hypothetical protein
MGIVFSGKYDRGWALVRPDQQLLLELMLDSELPKFFTGPLSIKCRRQRLFGLLSSEEENIDVAAWDEGSGDVQWEPVGHRVGAKSFGVTQYVYYTEPRFANIPERRFSVFSTTYAALAKWIWVTGLFQYTAAWWYAGGGFHFTLFELAVFCLGLLAGALLALLGKLVDFTTNRTSDGRSLPYWGVFMSVPRAAASVVLGLAVVLWLSPRVATRLENTTDDEVLLTLPKAGGGALSVTLPPRSSELLLGYRNLPDGSVRPYRPEEGRGFYRLAAGDRKLNVVFSTVAVDCDPAAVDKLNAFFGFNAAGKDGHSTSPDKKSCIVKPDVVLTTEDLPSFTGTKPFVGEKRYVSAELHFREPHEVVNAEPRAAGAEHPLMSQYHQVRLLENDFPSNRDDAPVALEADIAVSPGPDDFFRESRIVANDGHPIGPVYVPLRRSRPLEIPVVVKNAAGEVNRTSLLCPPETDPKEGATALRYIEIIDGAGRPVRLRSAAFKQASEETPGRYEMVWRIENEKPAHGALVCLPVAAQGEENAEITGRLDYEEETGETYAFSKAVMNLGETLAELRIEDLCFVDTAAAHGDTPRVKMTCKNPCDRSPDKSQAAAIEKAVNINELECMKYEYCGRCNAL